MARRKKIEPVETEDTSASTERMNPVEVETVEETPATPKLKRYVATRAPQFHPFARIRIPTASPGVPMEEDSWLQSQLAAGIVKVVE